MGTVPRAKILLIGDQEGRDQVVEILLRHSYAVSEATGNESLDRVKSFQPDLILFNAGKSQYQTLIAQLRTDSVLSPIPAILIVDDPDQVEIAAVEAGIADFLRKPLTEAEVIARIRTLLALKAARHGQIRAETRVEEQGLERTGMLERALRGQGVLLSEAQEARRV
jgi:adenylate cyclase